MLAHLDFNRAADGQCDPIVKEFSAYSHFESPKEADYILAAELYQELVALYPDNLKMKTNLACAHYGVTFQGLPPSGAITVADEILRLDPNWGAAHQIRALANWRYLDHFHLGDPNHVLKDVETALALGPRNPQLEIRRMKLLVMIAAGDPNRRDDLVAEIKTGLYTIAPEFQKRTIQRLAMSLLSIEDQPWLDAITQRCRTSPERKTMSYFAAKPSDAAKQQYLERAWD